ncbi:helix-turn-helix domain-containing protein [Sphaerisporangium corydalis]|uniref:Helix-turn-helix domain-containing protein n=1 Tax=Sphaerisporangium corydalis TaxID=1441875 RepID=A0ABV9E9G0_9ACTN|nr:helix-turn-helix transcriptional regulator [Sphaerisporangium corydalis]
MSREPDPVDASLSPGHLLGAALRHWRMHRGLALPTLAPMVLTSTSALSKMERGERKATRDVVGRLDEVLRADGFLVALYAASIGGEIPASADTAFQWDSDGMDRLRRRLLGGIATVGASAALPPIEELEHLRSVVDRAVGRPGIAEWEETAWEYAHAVFSPAISDVIRDLSVDILAIQHSMTSVPSAEISRWLRVNAQVTMLMAYALGCAGHSRESHHWWGSAQRAAEQTGDHDLLALMYAREAVQALHERRPLPLVLSRTTRALDLTQGRACVATGSALGARAHVYALMGHAADAYADLDEQARIFQRLPERITSDRLLVEGWPETRVLYSRSLVYTLTGHSDVDAAQRQAMDAYPSETSRQRTQVELHCAYSEVQRGHIDSGLTHARTVLDRMPPDHINSFMLHNAAAIATAVPAMESTRPTVIEYRKLFALPGAGRT